MLNNIISFPLDYSIILLYAQVILDFLLIGKMRHGICDNRTVLFNDATSDPILMDFIFLSVLFYSLVSFSQICYCYVTYQAIIFI